MFPWIVAAPNFHEIIAVIVLVMSVASWLVNLAQGNNPNGPPNQQKPKAKPTTRSELEQLIQELTVDKRKMDKRSESAPPAKPRPQRQRTPPSTVPQRPGSPPPYAPSRQPAPKAAEKKRPTAERTSSRVGKPMRSSQVGSHVESTVPDAVKADLPTPAPEPENVNMAQMPQKPVHPLTRMLREPGGVRQAMMLNEILQRPKALRR